MKQRPERNDPCWCGSQSKYKHCHQSADNTMVRYVAKGHIVPEFRLLKTKPQIDGIRSSGKINIEILDFISDYMQAGISTAELNQLIDDKTRTLGGIPAPLDYNGYPKSVCISINDEVCHGIPSRQKILTEGDIVNVDVSTIYNGFFSDSSRMFGIGDVSKKNKKLIRVAKECVELGLQQVRPWGFLGDIGQAVNDHARRNGYSVVREIGGHGVGLAFHEDPWVAYTAKAGTGMLLVPGMVFTIEPMVNRGIAEIYTDQENGWTIYTTDGKPSAQWEYMVLVTVSGAEVLAY